MSLPRLDLVLFDFDGVLAYYQHELRIAHLADAAGVAPSKVRDVLFDSGLETEYDGGLISTETYLSRLSDGLGAAIDTDTWTASRIAGSHPDPALIAQVIAVQQRVAIAVLTNNGALMAQAIRHIVPSLFPALEERVLCSGALRLRKPDPLIYREALQRLGVAAERTLFVDDMPDNVTGAHAAGLHAEQVTDAASLQQVLQRYGLV